MKSLFLIDGSDGHREVKEDLLKEFREKFTGAKLTRTEGHGEEATEKVIVPDNDRLRFTGFQVSRGDLLRYILALSDDLPQLKKMIDKLLLTADADDSHPINDESKAIWIDLGYGEAGPRVINNKPQKSGREMQLVITAVTDGDHPRDWEIGLVSATTARVNRKLSPTDPPFTTKVDPMT
jgi:hypothetical protein